MQLDNFLERVNDDGRITVKVVRIGDVVNKADIIDKKQKSLPIKPSDKLTLNSSVRFFISTEKKAHRYARITCILKASASALSAIFVLYKIFNSFMPVSLSLGFAFSLGIIIGIGSFALFINSLNEAFKTMYLTSSVIEAFKLRNSLNENFEKKYNKKKTFSQTVYDTFVLLASLIASLTESVIVFFSTVNVLKSLSLALLPSMLFFLNIPFYLIATVLIVSVFVTFLSSTARSIRKNFENKDEHVSNSERAEKSLNDLESTVKKAQDIGDKHTELILRVVFPHRAIQCSITNKRWFNHLHTSFNISL